MRGIVLPVAAAVDVVAVEIVEVDVVVYVDVAATPVETVVPESSRNGDARDEADAGCDANACDSAYDQSIANRRAGRINPN